MPMVFSSYICTIDRLTSTIRLNEYEPQLFPDNDAIEAYFTNLIFYNAAELFSH